MTILEKIEKVKDEIGVMPKSQENPFFHSKYFDINALLEKLEPLLKKQKLLLTQPLEGDKVVTVINDLDSEEKLTSWITIPEITDPQKMGSAITYYRRYTLQSLLALQSEDDDGNMASGNTEKKETYKPNTYKPSSTNKASEKQRNFVKSLFQDKLGIDLNKELAQKDFKRVCKFSLEEMTGKQASDLIEALQNDDRAEVIYQNMQGPLD